MAVKTTLVALIAAFFFILGTPLAWASPNARPALTQPTISPDGSTLAFAANGAIWIVSATGGTAHILVSDSANDSRPLFSPDGKHLVFVSDKTGNGDIYLLNLDNGALTRMTFADSHEQPSGFSSNGKWLYFTTSRGNIGGMAGVYRMRVSGGTPMPVSLELYRNEEAARRLRMGNILRLWAWVGAPRSGGATVMRILTRAQSGCSGTTARISIAALPRITPARCGPCGPPMASPCTT